MKENLIQRIVNHIFGRKYYCIAMEEPQIFLDNGKHPRSMSGYIFDDKESAKMYYYQLQNGKKKKSIEIISFRSHNEYKPFNNNFNVQLPFNM